MVSTRYNTDGRAETTGKLMVEVVNRYYLDMMPLAHLPLIEAFDVIKKIPFRPDPLEEETLMRPYYTMNMMGSGGDCDDKAIALASYCKIKGLPCRFVAVRRPDQQILHHVFTEIYIDNAGWIHADPTYRFNTLGREREQYAEYVIIGQV